MAFNDFAIHRTNPSMPVVVTDVRSPHKQRDSFCSFHP